MKVVAFSASPRLPSFTDRLLSRFIDGLGSDLELKKYYPAKMKAGPCLGCWDCWTKEPRGICRQKDDMMTVLPDVASADLIILASPLYFDGFTSQMKKILDRFLPLVSYKMIVDGSGHSRHPRLKPKTQKVILISSCGFPESDNFHALKEHFSAIVRNMQAENYGTITISAAGMAAAPGFFKTKYRLITQAGQALKEKGIIPPELLEEINQEVINRQDYRAIANSAFAGGFLGTVKALVRTIFHRKFQ